MEVARQTTTLKTRKKGTLGNTGEICLPGAEGPGNINWSKHLNGIFEELLEV